MSERHPIHVFSEIGRLKKVLLHRPGKELENLMPDYLERLLFDDIPYLEEAQKEHDGFAQVLRDNGVEVVYLEDLAAESLTSQEIREAFIDEYLNEADIRGTQTKEAIRKILLAIEDPKELIEKTMAGFQKVEIPEIENKGLTDLVESDYPFAIDPMPNLYFTRDPFATMGNGVSLNRMYSDTRNRETLYGKYIFTHHPEYKDADIPMVYDRSDSTRIEGGDELVLSKDVLAVGISQRTDAASIEKLMKNVFEKHLGFKKVLAFEIANNRKFMHLDTVFTMIDYDKFTIHPEIEGDLRVFSVTPGEDGKLVIQQETGTLESILASNLGVPSVSLIRCGGGNIVAAAREQWNDGSNTLTIAPGEVVVYDRNTVTNKKLEEAGIKLHKIRGSELVRGRGGPRCMSMPLVREDL
ncbi:arginine deiminase [Granulicatella seriolae]|uniref:Arginine deiminase n=1 Tax=Granulicatella seriolae TaxID=2967226 RepID=A0ABT1WM47_9LACT|nr:arginine deiminase [Granulicatella seriolae]